MKLLHPMYGNPQVAFLRLSFIKLNPQLTSFMFQACSYYFKDHVRVSILLNYRLFMNLTTRNNKKGETNKILILI